MKQFNWYFLVILILGMANLNVAKKLSGRDPVIGQHSVVTSTHHIDEASKVINHDKREKLLDIYLVPSKEHIGRYAQVVALKKGQMVIELVPDKGKTKHTTSGTQFLIEDNAIYHLRIPWGLDMVWVKVIPEVKFMLNAKDTPSPFIGFYGQPLMEREQAHYKERIKNKEVVVKQLIPIRKDINYQELHLVPSSDVVGKYVLIRVWQGKNIVDFVPDKGKVKSTPVGTQFLIEDDAIYTLRLPWNKVKMVWIRIPQDHMSAALSKYPSSSYIDFSGHPLEKREQSLYRKKLTRGKISEKNLQVSGKN